MLTLVGKGLQDLKPLSDPLAIYLNDHLGGATAGLELFRRAASTAFPEHRATLESLVSEIAEDRESLIDIMQRLDVPIRRYKVAAGWVGEKLGRFKPNGRLVGRSPLSSLIEVEALVIAVRGKLAGWTALESVASDGSRLSITELKELIARAERQSQDLEQMRQQIASRIFAQG